MLAVENVSFAVAGKQLLQDVSFELAAGEFLAVLGANGAGKTTLMNCLCGLNQPSQGRVKLNGQPLNNMTRAEIAQQMALVPQQQETAFAFTALEMVVMGRTPFLSTFESPSEQDIHDAKRVMQLLDVGGLAKADYNRLSGGERQLVLLARALFQSEQLLLLDEPTNHLDYRNKFQILSQVKRSCVESNTAVIAILHDPNLAQLYADKVLLLEHGKVLDYGERSAVMTSKNISRLYGLATASYQVASQEFFMPQNVLGLSLSKVLIVTGESGSGKTTALAALIEQCQQQQIKLKGMLCPGVMKDGRRFSSDIVDIATGERCLFGHRTGVLDKKTGTRFSFTEAGLALGLQALDHNNFNQGDICIVDEIGPMELGGQGFGKQIAPLLAVANSRHIWVVRPNLIEQVCRHWSLHNPEVIDIEDAHLPQKLMQFINAETAAFVSEQSQ
ncbi:ATP-binding cassette domain-containing protein [Shewanella fidelis]|uniref:ATP-binding cassette domain-containing protein n=1 Tax=Shewanella fidelis TaxID=173509 RepID=A0AAW8NKG3_9GAMM|nr:ATP-binding cassette domain-containing protein [Shewanella fidelis]MDR8522393.1 ATP-binding cassette domain-containing protein [Shewanella fidelis]MDW4813073.1 ATP-binding cassette domain-containing protein [Shewanella fidelis]MDW4816668.1 ATP-binding cassette domain-containing protein [Shewanella fidelis]MDW4821080.1 ATP-binding cassette domain-containing protein [Shewanella fidelis]MDW4825385.1 ATP-binding cassette domain-containing protein [Shewanella fidelis]